MPSARLGSTPCSPRSVGVLWRPPRWSWVPCSPSAGPAYYALDGLIERRVSTRRGRGRRGDGPNAGPALALGAFLDGIPEQLVLGIGLAGGAGVNTGLLVAIFVSNLPEAIGSASEMERGGTPRTKVLRIWAAVAAICILATVVGYAIADAASGELRAGIDGFAAGALLVMLIDSMIPEATRDARPRRRPRHHARLRRGDGALERLLGAGLSSGSAPACRGRRPGSRGIRPAPR
jgi:zinc transporter ZupT